MASFEELEQYHGTEEWFLCRDILTIYFSEIVWDLSQNLLTACKLKIGLQKNWSIAKLIEESAVNVNEENSFWYNTWEGLLYKIEERFGILIPKYGDSDPVIEPYQSKKNTFYSKRTNLGINPDINLDKFCNLVCGIIAGEELPEDAESTRIESCDSPNREWSDILKDRTRDILYELYPASFMRGGCKMKHIVSGHGNITMEDALSDQYKIRNIETGEVLHEFSTVDSLVEAGWAVD